MPELKTSVFLVSADDEHGRLVKNGEERLVVLNQVARTVIEELCNQFGPVSGSESDWRGPPHPGPLPPQAGGEGATSVGAGYVFTFRGRWVTKMNNTAWKRAWREVGLPVNNEWMRGVHNLKHTFGRRLRAAGVSLETRRVLLGHCNGDITSHYSAPEINELIDAANRVCGSDVHKTPTLTLLKRKTANR